MAKIQQKELLDKFEDLADKVVNYFYYVCAKTVVQRFSFTKKLSERVLVTCHVNVDILKDNLLVLSIRIPSAFTYKNRPQFS